MTDSDDSDVDRRQFMRFAGATGAATVGLAGCLGDDEDDTDDEPADDDTADDTDDEPADEDGPVDGIRGEYWDDRPEPEDREGYLERTNLAVSQEAAMLFLHQQQSIYGKSTRIDWNARVDEQIEAYDITPTDGGNDVVITQGQLDQGLDPHDHRETPTNNILRQAYEGLMRRDREGEVVARLAEDWERVEEGQARFFIRDGVTFHNGDPLTPEDIAFTINRIVDPDAGGLESDQRDQLAGVERAEAVPEEGAVDVFSDGLNPLVFQLFASYCEVVQEDWITERETDEINTAINGTGPFELVDYVPDEEVVFEAYEDYWQGEAEIDRLTMRGAAEDSTRVAQLLEGETDVIVNIPPEDVPRVEENDGSEVDAVGSTRVIFNGFVSEREPFSDPTFRRALNYAIDLESIIESVLSGFGTPLGQPTLPAFFGHNDEVDPYPQDQELADQLIEESGFAGEEIELNSPVGRYLLDLEVAEAIAGQVDELDNVDASVEQRDFGTLAGEITDGDIETTPGWYLLGWGNTTFDASQTLIPLLSSDGAISNYRNEGVDELIEQAQSSE